MSHELRTPLNSILGFTQLLEYDRAVTGSEATLKKVRNIHTAGRHLLSMIDDILDLSRIEIGGLTLSLEALDLDALVRECLGMIGPQAEMRALRVSFAPIAGNNHVLADRTRLRQILANLLSNAVKYNRSGGTINVSRRRHGDMIELAIGDSGQGLSAEQLAKLFQPFNRLGAEMGSTEGTGIGLVIVRQLVEKMGGSISVQSTTGKGSTFIVALPAASDIDAAMQQSIDAPPLPVLPPPVDPEEAGGEQTILYVEDNPANVELVRQFFALRTRFKLEIETDGIAGLARTQSLKPDLLLLDINLPGINGFEIMRRLRDDEQMRAMPVIALSANAMPAEIRQASDLGFSDYLTKPIDLQRLLTTMVRLLAAGPN
jgi:CheY-like chemotaxis protein